MFHVNAWGLPYVCLSCAGFSGDSELTRRG
jgi:hypothetical protein